MHTRNTGDWSALTLHFGNIYRTASLAIVISTVSTGRFSRSNPDPARPDSKLVKSFAETTRVTFAPLQEAEMRAYIKTGEPFDKAGGYGACFLSRGHSNTRTNTANLFYSHVVAVLLALYENKLLTSRVCLFRAQVSKVQQARLLAPSPGVTST